jgi:hypothetical protein
LVVELVAGVLEVSSSLLLLLLALGLLAEDVDRLAEWLADPFLCFDPASADAPLVVSTHRLSEIRTSVDVRRMRVTFHTCR